MNNFKEKFSISLLDPKFSSVFGHFEPLSEQNTKYGMYLIQKIMITGHSILSFDIARDQDRA